MATLRGFAAMSVLVFCLLLIGGCDRSSHEVVIATSVREEQVAPPIESPSRELAATQGAFIEVSRRVTPAVVNISAARSRKSQDLRSLFEEFFGQHLPETPRPQRREQSLGSGFILSADGYILTNEHVVKGAEEIKVKLSDQRVFEGQLVGVDPRTDVAVLKIEAPEKLPTAVLGDSDRLQVGQWALAIGNPFGFDRTLTVGVISGTGRANVGIEDYEDFIQTDASINPGNSGGPLLNIYGEVVGINTAIVAAGQGIGFAIPINLARLIAEQLIEKGEVVRGWLGVSIQPLTAELAESFGLDKVTGALVNQVVSGSPAEKAGLRRGDILLTFNGKEVRGVRELQLLVASAQLGRPVSLQVLRDGRTLKLQAVLAAQPSDRPTVVLQEEGSEQGRGLGMVVAPAPEGRGVVIGRLDPDSPAAEAGVRPGDRILSINREEINDLAAFERAVKNLQHGKTVVLLIEREGTSLYLAFPAP